MSLLKMISIVFKIKLGTYDPPVLLKEAQNNHLCTQQFDKHTRIAEA